MDKREFFALAQDVSRLRSRIEDLELENEFQKEVIDSLLDLHPEIDLGKIINQMEQRFLESLERNS